MRWGRGSLWCRIYSLRCAKATEGYVPNLIPVRSLGIFISSPTAAGCSASLSDLARIHVALITAVTATVPLASVPIQYLQSSDLLPGQVLIGAFRCSPFDQILILLAAAGYFVAHSEHAGRGLGRIAAVADAMPDHGVVSAFPRLVLYCEPSEPLPCKIDVLSGIDGYLLIIDGRTIQMRAAAGGAPAAYELFRFDIAFLPAVTAAAMPLTLVSVVS